MLAAEEKVRPIVARLQGEGRALEAVLVGVEADAALGKVEE